MKKISTPIVSGGAVNFIDDYFSNTRSGAAYIIESFVPLLKRTLAGLHGKFTRGELMLILDTFNATALSAPLAGQHLYLSCCDAVELDNADDQWGVDPASFLGKLEQLSPYQAACIEIWANGFWYGAAHIKDERDIEEYVAKLVEEGK